MSYDFINMLKEGGASDKDLRNAGVEPNNLAADGASSMLSPLRCAIPMALLETFVGFIIGGSLNGYGFFTKTNMMNAGLLGATSYPGYVLEMYLNSQVSGGMNTGPMANRFFGALLASGLYSFVDATTMNKQRAELSIYNFSEKVSDEMGKVLSADFIYAFLLFYTTSIVGVPVYNYFDEFLYGRKELDQEQRAGI